MSCYKNISSKSPKICIGKLSKRITLQTRQQNFASTGMIYTFVDVVSVWANVITRSGINKFSGINIDDNITHIWQIRRRSDITAEYWINYNDNRYKIESIEPMNEGNYLLLFCKLTGEDNLDGSES